MEGAKPLPHASGIERSVLGLMLMDEVCTEKGVNLLSADCFHTTANAIVFNTISTLFKRGDKVDIVTAYHESTKLGNQIDGFYLTELTTSISIPSHFDTHLKILAERFIARRLIALDYTMKEKAYDTSNDIFDVLDENAKGIEDLLNIKRRLLNSTLSPEVLIRKAIHSINNSEDILQTGIKIIDENLGGLTISAISSVLARPAHMKSTFTDYVCASTVKHSGVRGLIISLEDPTEQRIKRIVASELRLSLSKMRFKQLKIEPETVQRLFKDVFKNNLFIVDRKDVLTPQDAAAVIKEVQPKIVIVDHLQKFSDKEIVQDMMEAVKIIEDAAIRNNAHAMITSQVNDKQFIARPMSQQSPTASDAQWTSALIQSSAEMFSLLYRYQLTRSEFDLTGLEVNILKGRYAKAIGRYFLYVDPDQARFEEGVFQPIENL